MTKYTEEELLEELLNIQRNARPGPPDLDGLEERTKMMDMSRRRVLSKMLDEYHKLLYESKPDSFLRKGWEEDIFDQLQALKDEVKKENKCKVLFVTVNTDLKLNVTLPQLMKLATKCLTKKWIISAIYCFEQRGETEETKGEGLHMHFQCNRPEDKSVKHCVREIRNTFKSVVGTHLAIDFSFRKDGAPGANYIKGEKSDDDKLTKVAIDRIWRKENNIEDFYEYTKAN